MIVNISYAPVFERRYKRFSKKFASLESDLKNFIKDIETTNATDLGGGIFKYRLSVKSKNTGKSGGFRIITFEVIVSSYSKNITLLTLYDKSEDSTISKAEIQEIINSL